MSHAIVIVNMRLLNAVKIIKEELYQLDIDPKSKAYEVIYENAIAASEIMTKKELLKYINEYAEGFSFQDCGH